jgi:hypothetical protein
MGFHVAVLSNCYWATSPEDAEKWLLPIAETDNVELSLSSDLYHGESWEIEEVKNAARAAKMLNIKTCIITVKQPNKETSCSKEIEGAKVDSWDLMYKGRAFSKLTEKAARKPWHEFNKCPYENFLKQERVHVDPLGYVHVCQGISIGNAWQRPFRRIIQEYNPLENPILGPLIRRGPVALVEEFGLSHDEAYADACHFCSAARAMLRSRYPDILVPAQMYGEL